MKPDQQGKRKTWIMKLLQREAYVTLVINLKYKYISKNYKQK